jgi:hypothetical protein
MIGEMFLYFLTTGLADKRHVGRSGSKRAKQQRKKDN